MKTRNALTLAAALSVLSSPSVLSRTGVALAADAETRVLYPPKGAVVTRNPVLMMILTVDGEVPPAFELDGSPLPLHKMTLAEAWASVPARIPLAAGDDDLPLRSPLLATKDDKALWVTAEDLRPGEHTLERDGVTLSTFFFRDTQALDRDAEGDSLLRVHGSPATKADALNCAQCHGSAGPDAAATLGVVRIPESCHGCHDDVDLSLAHEHVMEFLAKCQMCHDPHGATRPSLLIDSREKVCGQCHEAGYAR